MQQLDYLQRRLVHPALRVRQQVQHLEQLRQRLQRAGPNLMLLGAQYRDLMRRWQSAMQYTLETRNTRLLSLQQHLSHLDPQQVLARGYSIVRDEHGVPVMDSAVLHIDANLDITFARGRARAKLVEKSG